MVFCRSCFINNFTVKNSFLDPKTQRKLNILRPVYFKKISAHRFVGLICTNKLEEFFFQKNLFQGLGAFSTKKNVILFFKGDYLILILY